MNGELPHGWVTTALDGLLTTLESGSRPRGGVRSIQTGIPSIGAEHLVYNGTFDFSNIKFIPRDFAERMNKGRIQHDDILVVKDGATTGKTSFVNSNFPFHEAFVNEHVFICRPTLLVQPRFLFCFLISREGQNRILANFKGSAQGGINQTFAPNTEVPLAPFDEQQRIVAKLDQLLPKVQICQERLEKIPRLLKRFRQSVLAAACSGKLTQDWRDSEEPERVFIEEVIEDLKYGTSQKCAYSKKGVPVLRIPNIGEAIVDHADIKYADLPKKEFEKLKLKVGDILMIRSNGSVSLVGKTAIVSEREKDFAYAGYLIRLRPKRSVVLPAYLNMALSSLDVRFQIEIPARSTSGVNNINSGEVKKLKIFLPTLKGQQEIVRRVEALFKLADQLEGRYKKAKASVDKLTQSILAKAFRGELVLQDPNDEPTSVLLERIKKLKMPNTKRRTFNGSKG